MSPFQNPHISTQEAVPTAVLRERLAMGDLASFYDRAYTAVAQSLAAAGVRPAGAAFGYYLSPPTGTFELEAGFPVDAPLVEAPQSEVIASELPAGPVARATHVGGYDTLGDSWQALSEWVHEQGRTAGLRMWEVYVTEPTPEGDPADNRTELFLELTD